MSVPSANTRASRNVRSTASQPLIEKPASRLTGCAGLEMDLPMAPMTMLRICSAKQRPGDRPQTVRVRGDERVARANRFNHREQPFQDPVVQRNRGEAENGDRAQAHDHPLRIRRRRKLERGHDPLLVGRDEQQTPESRLPSSQFRTMRIRSTTYAIGSAAEEEGCLDMFTTLNYRITINCLSNIVKLGIAIR